MSTPSWPNTLPQNQFLGMTEVRETATVRTRMDAGPAKVRQRFTAAVRTFSVPITLTGSQRSTFDTFFITTLGEGSISFSWVDPVTDSAINFRFVKPPTWKLDTGGASGARLWSATLELEVLP